MDNKTIYQVDAFTDRAFGGNPAGVMLLEKLPSEAWMQNMASEMNLSETAFVAPINSGFEIRYFTPTVEIPLCGHATLASAHIMYQLGIRQEEEPIYLEAKGGSLIISKEEDLIKMTFPQYNLEEIETPKGFLDQLGFNPLQVYKSDYNWIVAVAETQKDIEQCKPNFEALKSHGLGHLMVTSLGEGDDVDFVVRCFVPDVGINEDPVTGSAYCALTPLWSKKLNKSAMFSLQLSKRGGKIHAALVNDKVEIKGNAVTVFEGKLKL